MLYEFQNATLEKNKSKIEILLQITINWNGTLNDIQLNFDTFSKGLIWETLGYN